MANPLCYFCEKAEARKTVRDELHHPETLAYEVVEVPSCNRCAAVVGSAGVMIASVLLVCSVVGLVGGWMMPGFLESTQGVRLRGRARGIMALIGLAIGLVVAVVFVFILNAAVKAAFGMRFPDTVLYPANKTLLDRGYRWGKPPKRPSKA